ncbi:MAG: glycosyltransferase family 4 protein [Rhodospirillales bacterium]|nr:glycosyltransferase family 4 protein [Alphaproteobacteria bacterium]MCB9987340.1 glycosyltransferase family 4 protein [Rhodospirillales bacterium]USO07808.1 MAG: glycosyltransferase family 4 protein [Rhodospirillales bacterium]
MNILYIDHYAGSPVLGMEYRPYYLARQWVRMGHRVRIVSASYAHTRLRQPRMRGVIDRQGYDGIEYIFLRTPAYQGHGWRRVLNILAFVGQLYLRLRHVVRNFRPDIVIASSAYPFDMGPAQLIARAAGARLVYEVSELWPDSPMEIWGIKPTHPFMRLVRWGQRRACRAADVVISPLPGAEAYLKDYGLAPGKFTVIPNGIEPEEWEDPAQDGHGIDGLVQAVIDRFRAQGRMIVGYAGAHGETGALEVLVEAAAFLRDRKIAFICIGDGPYRAPLADFAEETNVADVFVFAGPLPKRQVPRFLRQMDVLYMGARSLAVYKYGVSFHKIYDYMMAGKPIVMAVDTGNDMLADSACGICVPTGDPKDVASALVKLLEMDPQERNLKGLEAQTHVLLHNAYPVLARNFLEAVGNVAI